MQNEDPFVRDLAFNCLGLACIVDVSLAQKYLLLFLQVLLVGWDVFILFGDVFVVEQVSQVDHELLQATALKIVFDLLHLFGFEAYATPDHQSGDGEQITVSNNCFAEKGQHQWGGGGAKSPGPGL